MPLASQPDDPVPLAQIPSMPEKDQLVASLTSPPPANDKTRAEYMDDMIVLNAAPDNQSDSDDKDDNITSERTRVLNSRKTHRRFVYNTWPHDPKLMDFIKVNWRQKKWAETLSDFYYVEPAQTDSEAKKTPLSLRKAAIKSKVVVTASMLRDFLASCKEGNAFGPYSKFLHGEDVPRSVPVYRLERLIRENESWILHNVVPPKRLPSGVPTASQETAHQWPPTSLFSPDAYPSPWPFEPFSKEVWHPKEIFSHFVHTPTLQQYIPRHLLPKTLVVHDPWGLLSAENGRGKPICEWVERDDVVHTYKLYLSKLRDARDRFQDDKGELEAQHYEAKAKIEAFLANPHSDTPMPDGMLFEPLQVTHATCGPAKPPVYIVFPPKPPKSLAEVAHLYLSKGSSLGVGNHSFVYRAEFEIPRSLVVDELLCKDCVMNDAKRILEEQDGTHGETRNAKWNDFCGSYVLKMRGRAARMRRFGEKEYEVSPDTREAKVEYVGPYRVIQTKVEYQNLERAPYCEHLRKDNVHPLTVKTCVAAKLSLEDDPQLEKEAMNYQLFPKHFFEHRNGFTILEGFENPMPTGAIVPQFYGHYHIDRSNSPESVDTQFYSPILLMEECGKSVDPQSLNADDFEECISLIYRFNTEDWAHGSLYRRNIVCQRGPLSAHPFIRQGDAHSKTKNDPWGFRWSFRLIDFGRSECLDTAHRYWDYKENMEYEREKVEGIRLGRRCLA